LLVTADDDDIARVQLLLSGLFLSHAHAGQGLLRRAPLEWISEWLGSTPVTTSAPTPYATS
jgi:hypothetical protein